MFGVSYHLPERLVYLLSVSIGVLTYTMIISLSSSYQLFMISALVVENYSTL